MPDVLEVPLSEPWLRAFVEDGDEDLDVVRQRFSEAQDGVKRALRRQHVSVSLRVRNATGALTTSFKDRDKS